MTRYAAMILAIATLCAPSAEAAPRDPGTFLLNVQGGVITCRLARAASERAFCAGESIAARDPARFDCRKAEVTSEFDFCGKPYPRRAR